MGSSAGFCTAKVLSVVEHIVGYEGYMSLREGNDDLLLRGGNREIVEGRRNSDNFFDIVSINSTLYCISTIFLPQGV